MTQAEYERVMEMNPSRFQGDPNRPVDSVSWKDAQEYCRRLSALPEEKESGRTYRLPTEAEWEYACRAGTCSRWCFGDEVGRLRDYAWFSGNSGEETHPVGQKKANPWGLYDMHGNVWEWCQDSYRKYETEATLPDKRQGAAASRRVFRGGGWFDIAKFCRSACRLKTDPNDRDNVLGFRVSMIRVKT